MSLNKNNEWWKSAVIYHIYPRSFQDSNGDGIGDLNGITSRLDYLDWLGIDAMWLSPVYPSPMADFGYDVSNHCDIDPMFGTLDDMDRLIEEAHSRDLKIILDFVPNHTSDQHPWFLESKSSRDNPKRGWYYWKNPAADGGPPNNWLSRFDGESAWKWDEQTGQYYLHSFLEEQPDLNWRHPAVRESMLDILRFWYDRGVDGFRVDVSYRVMKDPDFRDNPINPNWKPGMDRSFQLIETHTKNTPDIHTFNRWIRQTNDEYDDRVTIGEMNLSIPELVKHYGSKEKPEFHLPFNFRLIFSDWEAENVRDLVAEFEKEIPNHGWPNWVLSNHDQPRFSSRAGIKQARNGLLFLLTVRGTPTVYYGEEIGMENVEIPPDKIQDPWEILSPNMGLGRDPERTPMRWDSSETAGFCKKSIEPWLPVGNRSKTNNVAAQTVDPDSTLNFVRQLIQLRREKEQLKIGQCRPLKSKSPILAYLRFLPSDESVYLTLLNLSHDTQIVDVSELLEKSGFGENEAIDQFELTLLITTHMDNMTNIDHKTIQVRLRANEGILLELKKNW